MKNTTTDVEENNLQCGQVYYVDIPKNLFEITGVAGQNTNSFLIESKTILKRTGSVTGEELAPQESPKGYVRVDFVHVELFPLD